MTFTPDYVFEGEPALGETMEVHPGIHWLRMPLPFKLDHINLWLLEDGDGWTIVDTGICTDVVKEAWETLFAGVMQNRPVKRVIVTHFHPDHAGLAGWLTERFDVPLVMPLTEWTFGRMLYLDGKEESVNAFRAFYKRAGFSSEMMDTVHRRAGGYQKNVSPIPAAFERISDGDTLEIGGRIWRMIVGRGHSPEHACLYCNDADVIISGDQVLPKISPNVSVWPQEPEGQPLGLYIESLNRLRVQVAGDPLVLPSHNWPFKGFHARLDDLGAHHVERLDETVESLYEPSTGVEVLYRLFKRELDEHQTFFAIGETLAHLHHLIEQGRARRDLRDDGVDVFSRAG
ncbi:MAG: MBL fold metallo-hydrolase [Rhodospirillales bacterium]